MFKTASMDSEPRLSIPSAEVIEVERDMGDKAEGRGQRAESREQRATVAALCSTLFASVQFFGEGDDHSGKYVEVVQDWRDVCFKELSSLKYQQHAGTFK